MFMTQKPSMATVSSCRPSSTAEESSGFVQSSVLNMTGCLATHTGTEIANQILVQSVAFAGSIHAFFGT